MTPEAQRIAIAEACGWKWYKHTEGREYRVLQLFPYNQTAATMDEPIANPAFMFLNGDIPDYPADLNAMHEAEKVLNKEQGREYVRKLYQLTKCDFEFHCAAAAQRAEAFLWTIGKWDDSK